MIHFSIVKTSIQLHVKLNFDSDSSDAASPSAPFAILLGLVSIAVSSFWIGVHLDFFNKWGIQEGGWFELFSSFFLIFVWIVGVGIFTADGRFNEAYPNIVVSYQDEYVILT